MAKNPLDDVPVLSNEEIQSSAPQDNDIPNEKFTKGNTSRTIFSSLKKMMIPALAVAVGAWLLWPDQPLERKIATDTPVTVDADQQNSDVKGVIIKLKEDAEAQQAAAASTTISGSNPAGEKGPYPGNTGQGKVDQAEMQKQARALAKMQAELQDRDETIRASALEATGGSFKLLSDRSQDTGTNAGFVNASAGNSINDMQKQLDDFQRNRGSNDRASFDTQTKLLEAMNPKPAPQKSRDEQFMEQQSTVGNDVKVLTQRSPMGRFIVNEGTPIRSVLITGVHSDLPGKISAMVTSDVYDSNLECTLIPKGSKIIGSYNNAVLVGQERILMAMNRLILPNGSWIPLAGARATDMIGLSGMDADVNNHFLKIFGSSLIIGAATLMLPNDQNTITSTATAGGVQNSGSVFAGALNDTVKTLLDRNKMIAPTLTLKPGQPFLFLVAQDMSMTCYH